MSKISNQLAISLCRKLRLRGEIILRCRFPKAHQFHHPQTQYFIPSNLHSLDHFLTHVLAFIFFSYQERRKGLFPHLLLQLTTTQAQITSSSHHMFFSFSFLYYTCLCSDCQQFSLQLRSPYPSLTHMPYR